jgi:predicted transcriptional regulator
MAKRAKLEVMKDILKIIKDNKNMIKPTPLLRKSGLSSVGFKEYYTELLGGKFINEITEKNEKFITVAEKGFKFLERYRTIVDFIDEFEL